VSVCACIRTYTHTMHMGYSDVSLGVWARYLEGPKNPDGLNLGIYVFVYVYRNKVHMIIVYMLGGETRDLVLIAFFLSHFFFLEKEKQKI